MQIKNSLTRYGSIGISLHWLMAVLMIGMLALGWYMVALPISLQKLKWYGWHKEIGMAVLILAVFRLFWRMINSIPILPAHLSWWQKSAAHAVHYAFYIFMFGLPISGWIMSSAAGISVSFFGWFVMPDLVSANESLRLNLAIIHRWLGYGLIATILAHTFAALQHHFICKDDILKRMLP